MVTLAVSSAATWHPRRRLDGGQAHDHGVRIRLDPHVIRSTRKHLFSGDLRGVRQHDRLDFIEIREHQDVRHRIRDRLDLIPLARDLLAIEGARDQRKPSGIWGAFAAFSRPNRLNGVGDSAVVTSRTAYLTSSGTPYTRMV